MYTSLYSRKRKKAKKILQDLWTGESSPTGYSGKIFPSGKFTCGRFKKKPHKDKSSTENIHEYKRIKIHSYDESGNLQVTDSEGFFVDKKTGIPTPGVPSLDSLKSIKMRKCQAKRPPGGGLTISSFDGNQDSYGGHPRPPLKSEFLLSLSTVRNCRRYGKNGITKYGRNTVKECAYLLEEKYGKKGIAFYTLTCPYSDIHLVHLFSSRIADIQKRFFERMRRLYSSRGKQFDYVCVSEIQAKRMQRYGAVALHLHYLCNAKMSSKPGDFVCSFDEIRSIWHQCITNICGVVPNSKCSVDGALVKYNAAKYAAKYASKGKQDIKKAEEICEGICPRQWWSANIRLKMLLKKRTVSMQCQRAKEFWHFIEENRDNADLIYAVSDVCIEFSPEFKWKCGYSGIFEKNCKEDLTRFWQTS